MCRKDDVQAYAWLDCVTVQQGNPRASALRGFVADRMTDEGRANAQKLAAQYRNAYVSRYKNLAKCKEYNHKRDYSYRRCDDIW